MIRRLSAHPVIGPTVAMLISTLATSVLGYLFWTVQSWWAPASQVGEGSAIVSIATTAAIVTTAGLQPALLLAVPRIQDNAAQRSALISIAVWGAGLISSLLTLIAVLVLPNLLSTLTFLQDPLLATGTVLLACVMGSGFALDSASVASNRSKFVPLRNVGMSLTKLMLMVAVFNIAASASIAAIWGWVCAGLLFTGWFLRRLNGSLLPKRVDIGAAWVVLKQGLGVHHISAIGGQLPAVIFPTLVAATLGTTQTAYFALTWLLGSTFSMVSPAVSNAVIASTAADPEHLNRRARNALLLTAGALLGPLVVVLWIPGTVLLLFGPQYAAAGSTLLVLLALASIPEALLNVAVAVMRVRNELAWSAAINVTRGILAVALALVMLRTSGITGAGWAWLSAQTLTCLPLFVWYYQRGRKPIVSPAL